MSEQPDRPQPPLGPERTIEAELAAALPGLARVYTGVWARTARYAAESVLDTGSRTLRAAARGETPGQILDELTQNSRERLRVLLGIPEVEELMRRVGVAPERPAEIPQTTSASVEELQAKGTELLYRSGQLGEDPRSHPAYMRILEALSPDEARILHLFMRDGSQPSVDVRTWMPFDVGSHLIEQGLSMIAREAGARHQDRQRAYLNNLFRLGLIWFSREPLTDLPRYLVLEAQPEVIEAVESVRRARIVRRSIHLTDFGRDFCQICLSAPRYEIGNDPRTSAKGSPLSEAARRRPPADGVPVPGTGDPVAEDPGDHVG